jgi:predicted GH43/DUF377 family glycosyl hydrolase
MSEANGVIFAAKELAPPEWSLALGDGPVRTFNPALLREPGGWLLAARVVGTDGARRIALCRLDDALRVQSGSHLPLSDLVSFRLPADAPAEATRWFADPRLYRFGERVFIYWNSGWHEPRNYQFLQELDRTTLRPIGPARELALRGERRKLEKNWMLFATPGGRLRAIYSVLPHVVLEFSLEGDGDILFEEIARTEWMHSGYPASHGGLRGGAPPVLVGDRFWSICHSVHDAGDGYRYAAAAYSFSPDDRFAPADAPTQPLSLWNPLGGRRVHARLNPAVGEVIYPCGAVHEGARWWISYGINDEQCAISHVEHADVVRTTRAVSRAPLPE